jgi:hypothetical protein
VASIFKFLLALRLLLARPASIKWILLATRNFHSPLASWRAVISHTAEVLLILRWHHSSTLKYYWFSGDLILAQWSIIDSQVTFYHASTLKYYWFSGDLILAYWSIIVSQVTFYHASTLKYYWFSGDLILVYWSIIDSHVTSFQHSDVLLILMWCYSHILMCYWFSCDLIPA